MTKWAKTTFTPHYMGKPMGTVPAYTNGLFTAYKLGKGWALAHNASGLDICNKPYPTLKAVKLTASDLEAMKNIDWTSEDPLTEKNVNEAMRIRKLYA